MGILIMDYKKKIIEMLNNINNERFLKMIYGFVSGLWEDEHES